MSTEKTWLKVGEQEIKPEGRAKIEEAIKELDWQELPCTLGMMQGEGIKETIKELKLPKVSHVSEVPLFETFGLYGIRSHYEDGVSELYVMDTGIRITPILAVFHRQEKATEPCGVCGTETDRANAICEVCYNDACAYDDLTPGIEL